MVTSQDQGRWPFLTRAPYWLGIAADTLWTAAKCLVLLVSILTSYLLARQVAARARPGSPP